MSEPNKMKPCYDCGSTIKGHHTFLCEFVRKRDRRDLPASPGTQWWNKKPPIKASTRAINELYRELKTDKSKNKNLRDYERRFRALPT